MCGHPPTLKMFGTQERRVLKISANVSNAFCAAGTMEITLTGPFQASSTIEIHKREIRRAFLPRLVFANRESIDWRCCLLGSVIASKAS